MGEIQDIINNILSKIKVSNILNDEYEKASNYNAEPILKTASEIINTLPYKYREMRKMKLKYAGAYYDYHSKLFYEQGKFMENFEDDYEFKGEFIQYFPTYQAMNDNQLRGYFSWRTKLRKGIIEKTSISFIFLYIYELLNNIGVASPVEGFEKLIYYKNIFIEYEPKINHYLNIWIYDYVIYYGLNTDLLFSLQNDIGVKQLNIIFDYKNYSKKELTEALNYYSNYNLTKSKFYLQYKNDTDEIIYRVFTELTEFYNRHRKSSFFTKLFGNKIMYPYFLFNNAIFYKTEKIADHVVILNNCEKFIVKNGYWQKEYYFGAKKRNKTIGEILKTTDCLMRTMFGFTNSLSLPDISKVYITIIEKEIQDYCMENNRFNFHMITKKLGKKKAEEKPFKPAPVNIDTSKFKNIRETAEKIQKRLIVEENNELIVKKEMPVIEDNILNHAEIEIIEAIIENNDNKLNNILKNNGIMLSVIIDSINKKLFAVLNDNPIEITDNKPEILEDYLFEVKGILNI